MIETIGLVARFVGYIAILAAVGAVAFRRSILKRSGLSGSTVGRGSRRSAAIGAYASLAIFAVDIVKLVLQTAEMRFASDPWVGVGLNLVLHTSWGTAWMVQVACAALLFMTFTLARKDALPSWNVLAVLSVILAATPAFASHAMAAHRFGRYAVVADIAHVIGASLWLGTLGVMFASIVGGDGNEPQSALSKSELRSNYIESMLRSFSPLALVGSAIVVLTGVLSSLAHFEHFGELTSTRYGLTLVAKVISVGVIVLFGWRNWKYVTPFLKSQGPARMTRSMAAELVVTLVVIGITAALVVTPPPTEMMGM